MDLNTELIKQNLADNLPAMLDLIRRWRGTEAMWLEFCKKLWLPPGFIMRQSSVYSFIIEGVDTNLAIAKAMDENPWMRSRIWKCHGRGYSEWDLSLAFDVAKDSPLHPLGEDRQPPAKDSVAAGMAQAADISRATAEGTAAADEWTRETSKRMDAHEEWREKVGELLFRDFEASREACWRCRFFSIGLKQQNLHPADFQGTCHRFPPRMDHGFLASQREELPVDDQNQYDPDKFFELQECPSAWPFPGVWGSGWCGEFERDEDIPEEP